MNMNINQLPAPQQVPSSKTPRLGFQEILGESYSFPAPKGWKNSPIQLPPDVDGALLDFLCTIVEVAALTTLVPAEVAEQRIRWIINGGIPVRIRNAALSLLSKIILAKGFQGGASSYAQNLASTLAPGAVDNAWVVESVARSERLATVYDVFARNQAGELTYVAVPVPTEHLEKVKASLSVFPLTEASIPSRARSWVKGNLSVLEKIPSRAGAGVVEEFVRRVIFSTYFTNENDEQVIGRLKKLDEFTKHVFYVSSIEPKSWVAWKQPGSQ